MLAVDAALKMIIVAGPPGSGKSTPDVIRVYDNSQPGKAPQLILEADETKIQFSAVPPPV